MPRIEEISYSREETVAAVRDYYRFLVGTYLDESDVLEPPEGGWPSIPLNGWKDFNKTEEVVALLRELPYLRDTLPDPIHGAPYTVFANWQNTDENIDGESLREWSEPSLDDVQIPAHIVGLTVPSRRSPAMLLDTELGVIYWHECGGQIGNFELSGLEGDAYDWVDDGVIPEDQLEWRVESGIWPIANFFRMLKGHFQRLDFVPLGSCRVQDVWVGQSQEAKETLAAVQDLYRKHGWPDMTRFNKQACSAEVKKLLAERD